MKDDNLKIYLQDIQNYPLLTEAQEKNLGYLLLKGTERQKKCAAKKLVEGNLRLVVYIVKQLKIKEDLKEMDLIQQGNLGLIHATEKYDVTKGVKFSTYSAYWIKAYISSYIAKDVLIKHPATINIEHPISLDFNSYEESLDELYGSIPDPNAPIPLEEIEKKELSTICQEVLDSLPAPVKSALYYRMGFDIGSERTLNETADLLTPILGKRVSKEYVRQLCQRGIMKIIRNKDLSGDLKEFY